MFLVQIERWNSIPLLPVWTWDWKHAALPVVRLHGVGGEGLRAVLAGDEPLGAGVGLVCAKAVARDPAAALVLAVDGLEAAGGAVLLHGGPGELALAVGAGDGSAGARGQQVVLHHEAGDLGAAHAGTPGAGHGVALAGVQVGLELAQWTLPLASVTLQIKIQRSFMI